jgi:MoxR-like ATPase
VTVSDRPEAFPSPWDGSELDTPEWWIYRGTGRPLHDMRLEERLPAPPPWRQFDELTPVGGDVPPPDDGEMRRRLGNEGVVAEPDPRELDMVNATLYLRKPLLVTGPPGAGKSSLAFRISRELNLGRVIRWHITSNTTFKNGLYSYDAIGRAEAAATKRWGLGGDKGAPDISTEEPGQQLGDYIRLGPLGTAFLPRSLPRILLIDELDKSEVDLPNDLLGIFEEGAFSITELARVQQRQPTVSVFTDDQDEQHSRATITGGRVRCAAFPVIIITSNGERDFPTAFLRRCLQLDIPKPSSEKLAAMAAAHLADVPEEKRMELVQEFVRASAQTGGLPADRFLEALFLVTSGAYRNSAATWPRLRDALWQQLRGVV